MICEKCEALNALIDGYRRERDEARAEMKQMRSWIYRTRKDTQADPNEEITDDPVSLLTSMFYDIVDSRNAYRRGAEAMREHIAEVTGRNAALEWVVELVRALPIPEEP